MTSIRTRPGFSVMETLVAVALLAIAIIPLYAFQQTLANTAARLQTASDLLDAQESALAVLQTIDPIAQPTGEMDLGEWRLSWESRELASESPADGYLGASIWGVGLYEVQATLERGETRRDLTIRRVGWVQVYDPTRF
ncbi:type IV pilus modification PilV family protein [Oceanicaulis sp.]|uniref:type IV pilus modification PilV family protein n=1 Tax=Oceanicaulis sp. TaxID=1924941 RepID=UPI003F71B8E7